MPDPPARLGRFLDDPRFTFRIADGRNALDRDGAAYDLIEADALWPTSPYAGNLYSLEFFQLCARRLNPGGMVTTWAPTDRVRATFRAALPYVVSVAGGDVLIGSALADSHRSPRSGGAVSSIRRWWPTWARRAWHGVWAEIAGAQALPAAARRRAQSRSLPPRRVPLSGLGLHSKR